MFGLGALGFGAPWALLGLVALPGVWFLLRATPPSPRVQLFPAIAILRGLGPTPEAPARTPWWLAALRLAAAAAAIIGLAEPRWGGQTGAGGDGPVVVIVDKGWSAAAHWPQIADGARAAIVAAAQNDRPVALAATAPAADGTAP
ncbi:MAG: BatA domain-containing protein, partial [Pseudomonadota bacterium]